MTTTTHTAIGTVIGLYLMNPLLGFVVGFVSHFLVDMIPHGDSALGEHLRDSDRKKTIPIAYGTLDILVAFFLLIVLVNVRNPQFILPLTMAIAGSVFPDLLIGVYEVTKTKYLRWFSDLHFYFHDFFIKRHKDVKLHYSLAGQAVFIVILLNVF